ncbi:HAMP domain-containing sensor histidine kinase [Clostridium sp. AL.422]|uniref:sensor histidine kinase n=1 Tax=Clostridium TaxID=1485 RepID=UPI00293DCFE8|nr:MULTISPECIES: HAMP domain-containing sensor histidine kinase [unclassified Clostridium]MDV4150754.1 HAMP domain-containing sensor histidine kinase [Clostridium sp. AL.422]
MRKRKLPIFLELTRGSLLIIVSILAIYTIIQIVTFGSFSDEYEREYLIDKYNEITSLSKNINIEISETGFNEYLKAIIGGENDEHIRIYSRDKLYYEDKSEVWNKIDYFYDANSLEIKVKIIDFDTYRILSGPVNINGNKYNLQIIQESDIFGEFIESYFPTLVFILVLGIILSVIGAMYVSRNFIKRLTGLTETMNEIKEKGINKRAEISELNDEVDKVKVVFNSMMDELEGAFDEQSRFVSDASHELKTPLTALHGHLSMLKRWGKNDKERLEKSLDICLNEVERLKKIVNDMLILSKAEKTEINLSDLEEIDPKIVVNEVIEQYRVLNPDVKYIINIEENIKIKIDPNDLKQLLIIFIDNSIKYNNKENIEIQIMLRKVDNQIKLEVKDNGIGIPRNEIRNVMKRFYKVDKSRVNNNSFGIGLSIANRIVNNYNSKINIESELNKYTKITVDFLNLDK